MKSNVTVSNSLGVEGVANASTESFEAGKPSSGWTSDLVSSNLLTAIRASNLLVAYIFLEEKRDVWWEIPIEWG